MTGYTVNILIEYMTDYEKEARRLVNKLLKKGFHEVAYTHGTNVVNVSIKHKFAIPKALATIKEAGVINFYVIIPDEVEEVSHAIKNHEFFKAFTLCVSLYESFGKNILIEHFKGKLSLNSDRLERLGITSVILLLYTNRLIEEGTYSDMKSVSDTRNDLVHRYMSRFMSDKFATQIEEDIKKIPRSLRKLKEINDKLTKR